MKKTIKNNKGYMLIEIVIASVIALVMAYFLIDITLKLVNKNNDYYLNSTFLADKNIVTKEIMDDINSKKLVKVEKIDDNNVKLTYDDGIIKDLSIENKTIIYGNYKKQMSEKLNMDEIKIDADGNILKISIPMYSNYSKENYGISISLQYSEDLEIVLPLITGNADITVTNIKVGNSIATKFPTTGIYNVNVNCDGATAVYNYNANKLKITGVSVPKNANCSPIFTTSTKITLANYIINLVGTKTSVSATSKNDGSTLEKITENGEKDYRYRGVNPNNYVWFNNELWRIIGVFDSKTHGIANTNLVKIIRNDSIGGYVYDNETNVPDPEEAYGRNNYPTSDIYKLLNTAYYNAINGTGKDYCYFYKNTQPGKCNFTATGIQDEYRNMIEDNVNWFLGGSSNTQKTKKEVYGFERGTRWLYEYNYKSTKDSGLTTPIGLMYMSDYGYSALKSCTRDYADWFDDDFDYYIECVENNWLKQERTEWMITHHPDFYALYIIRENGSVNISDADDTHSVRPVLYLKKDVRYISGEGTQTNPYIIAMN